MENRKILDKVLEILPADPRRYHDTYVRIHKESNWILILYGAMYSTPEVSFSQLKQLSEFFKTDLVSLNLTSSPGCETCDYGSDYCNEIRIKESFLFKEIDWNDTGGLYHKED